jgi:hypothetical protein
MPKPDPTPTQQLSLTATATAVATPISTPAAGSTQPTGSTNTNTVQTPTSSTTPIPNQPDRKFLIVGGVVFLALLIVMLIFMLLIRRKKAQSKQELREVGTFTYGMEPWLNQRDGYVTAGYMPFPTDYTPNNSVLPPVPPANGVSISPPYSGSQPASLSPQQLQVSPYVHLLQQPEVGSTSVVTAGTIAPDDPDFEAIKKQAQMGLFAIPGQRQESGSSM